MDGVYFFGGVNFKGELSGKLKYMKAQCSEGKVMSIEFQKLKQQGNTPAGRTGHQMEYLPVNESLPIVGGRNGGECRTEREGGGGGEGGGVRGGGAGHQHGGDDRASPTGK